MFQYGIVKLLEVKHNIILTSDKQLVGVTMFFLYIYINI